MTQSDMLLKVLRDLNDWYPAVKLRGRPTRYGFLGSESDRRLLELEEDGLVEGRRNGKFKEYRAKQPTKVEIIKALNPDGTVYKEIRVPVYEKVVSG